MKKLFFASAAILFSISIFGCRTEYGAQPQLPTPDSQQLRRDLATIGWVFTTVDPSNTTKAFKSSQKVIETLKQLNPEFSQASNVSAHLGTLHKPYLQEAAQAGHKVDPTFINPRLVWIVTLSGIIQQSSGPPGKPRKQSNELNIIADAKTGKYLMSFVWTR